MGTTSLLQLRNDARQRADLSGSAFIPDDEWNFYANSSLAELHDLIVSRNTNFFLTSSVFTLTNAQSTQALPTDCEAVAGLERSRDGSGNPGTWQNAVKLPFRDRNLSNNALWTAGWYVNGVGYDIRNDTLYLQPVNGCQGTYQLWYYPDAPKLVNDTDVFDDRRYWYEYVVVDMAIKALEKQEDDTSSLERRKEQLKARVESMAADRDYSAPETVGVPYRTSWPSGWPGAWGSSW